MALNFQFIKVSMQAQR